jgi:hypothetical protein
MAGAVVPLALAAGATPAAAEYWPVICRGPVANLGVAPNRLIITARAGRIAGRPRRGECVWLDRGMTRRGEARYGGRVIFNLDVPVRASVANRNGRVIHHVEGDPRAVAIWNANAAGRTFRFGARRIGVGVYRARIEPTAWPGGVSPGGPSVPDPARARDVRITIDSIRVVRDGDSISPGDWFVTLAAGTLSGRTPMTSARWPRRGTRDVRDGEVIRPRSLRAVLRNVRPTDTLRVAILATDCDSDTLFELGGRLPGDLGRFLRELAAISGSGRCSGEEFGEMSGSHDTAGTLITLRGGTWGRGMSFVRRVRGDEVEYIVRGRITPLP